MAAASLSMYSRCDRCGKPIWRNIAITGHTWEHCDGSTDHVAEPPPAGKDIKR